MAVDLLRETTFGQLARYATGNRVFLYPEEKPGFECPADYAEGAGGMTRHRSRKSEKDELARGPRDIEETINPTEPTIQEDKVAADTEDDEDSSSTDETEAEKEAQRTSNLHRTESLPYSPERLEIDRIATLDRTKSIPIKPAVTADGTILVDWYVPTPFSHTTSFCLI